MTDASYLRQFGYLQSPIIEDFGFGLHKAFAAPDRLLQALRAFQSNFGLPVTGEFDEATLNFMEQPRCGFPDVGQFVLQGNRWITRDLHYGFRELHTGLPTTSIRSAIVEAFKLWSDVTNLSFREDPDPDLLIRFVSGDHGDNSSFDGQGSVLAHAYFPPPNGGALAGDTHFDNDERWSVSGSGIDLITVAAHEFGHALGLAHSFTKGAMMYPYYSGPERHLQPDDIAGIQALYGTKVTVTPEPAPRPLYFSTRGSLVFHKITSHPAYTRVITYTSREAASVGRRPCMNCKP